MTLIIKRIKTVLRLNYDFNKKTNRMYPQLFCDLKSHNLTLFHKEFTILSMKISNYLTFGPKH